MTNKLKTPPLNTDILFRLVDKFRSVGECNEWVAEKTAVSTTTASIWRVKNTNRPIPRLKLKELMDAVKSEFPDLII